MSVLVNGEVSPYISALDRGAMYGQCIFETIAVSNGQACLLDAHLQRLKQGAELLNIDYDQSLLVNEINASITGISKAVLRVNLTMGEGGRGYLNPVKQQHTRILSLHDYPIHPKSLTQEGIELGTVDIRLSHQPVLSGIKHGNRLEQIIARSQWKSGWHEALILDINENVIEATQSNVFIVSEESLITPCLMNAGVAGVMRENIIKLAQSMQIPVEIKPISVDDVIQADAVFLTNSVIGLWPVKQYNQRSYNDLTIANKLLKKIIKNEFIPII